MTINLGGLLGGKKEDDSKGKTMKIVEGFMKDLDREQLTFGECVMVSEILRNSLMKAGTDYLNGKYLNHINQKI